MQLTKVNRARLVASPKTKTELAIGEFAIMAETIMARSARFPQRKKTTSSGPTNNDDASKTKTRTRKTTKGEKHSSGMANHGLNSVSKPEDDDATNAGEEERFRRGRRRKRRAPSFERTENDEQDETRGMRSFFFFSEKTEKIKRKERKENQMVHNVKVGVNLYYVYTLVQNQVWLKERRVGGQGVDRH